MTIEVHPVGDRCNLSCIYCYEKGIRLREEIRPINMEEIVKAVGGCGFTVFGGEPLLTPYEDLETLFQKGATGIQTNGTMITARHIELFKKYKIHVGISVDGPDEMNDARRVGDLEATRRATEMTHAAIRKLLEERVTVSLIITLHRLNISEERRPRFKKWIKYLDGIGVPSARFHFLENDGADEILLPEEENIVATLDLLEFVQTLNTLKIDLFTDMERALRGEKDVVCVWNGCDPYATSSVRAVDVDGSVTSCHRTSKDGVVYRRADSSGNERILALSQTPQEYGGCKGCRYLPACKGHCPGTGLDGDWRNRTSLCGTLKAIFAKLEEKVVAGGGKIAEWEKEGHSDQHGDSHDDAPHIDRVDFGVVEVRQ